MYRHLMTGAEIQEHQDNLKKLSCPIEFDYYPKGRIYNPNMGILVNPMENESIDLGPDNPNLMIFVKADTFSKEHVIDIWAKSLEVAFPGALQSFAQGIKNGYVCIKVVTPIKQKEIQFLGALKLYKQLISHRISFWTGNVASRK